MALEAGHEERFWDPGYAEELEAERDRLREALEWIAGYGVTRPMLVDAPPLTQTAMREIARAALDLGSEGG